MSLLMTHFHTLFKYTCAFFVFVLLSVQGHAQTADFTFSAPNNAFCNPTSVSFTSTASGSPTAYLWDFGNGTSSTSPNASSSYTAPGNYTVMLSVIYLETAVSVTKTVVIYPQASITISADRNYICKPGTVQLNVSGIAGIGTYRWSFGDGVDSTSSIPNVTHNFGAFGNYNVSVIATNANGCSANTSMNISVRPPGINANVSPQDGCIPANASFNASVDLPANSSVRNYVWTFGDATPTVTTTAGNTSHTYTSVGGYNASVFVTTSEGCTNTFNYNTIAFGTPPINLVAYPQKDTICASSLMVAVAKATNANRYAWDFGDGTTTSISDTITNHKYLSLGSKTITVTPSFNGCNAASQTFEVFVQGVIAGFSYTNDCTNHQNFAFTDTTKGNISSRLWRLGEGTTDTMANFVHRYIATGAYTVSLSVYDSLTNCVDSTAKVIYYSTPTLLSNDTLVCKGAYIGIAIADNYAANGATYTWRVAGDNYGASGNANFNGPARYHGIFSNSVVIDNGVGYCVDTLYQTKPIRVRGIQMGFDKPDSICLNVRLNVTNTSSPYYAGDSVRTWSWNMGNSNRRDTLFQPTNFLYNNPGNYNIYAFATDKNGCKDSMYKSVRVDGLPFIRTIPRLDTLCFGQSRMLVAFRFDSLRWSPASVSCINCDTTFASPTTTTKYAAIVTNKYGCVSTDTSTIRVFEPFRASGTFTDTAICVNDSVYLNVGPTDKNVYWSPIQGLTSNRSFKPGLKVSQSTSYQALLIDSVGCFRDSITVNVIAKTLPFVDAGPSGIYPYNASVLLRPFYGSNVINYKWSPAALLSCTTCAIPTVRNEYTQTYTVKVTSDSGCINTDSVKIIIECRYAYLLLPTAFSPDNNGLNDYYYPLTRGVSRINNFLIYNRNGQLVYQAKNFLPNDRSFGWDGRYKGEPQPQGAYVYTLEATCDAGETLTRKGSFILMK
jgi:gliding motility-associated-like protein